MTKRWLDSDGVHLDLRGLEAPQPAVTILREIDGGHEGPLTVHLDREPIYLFTELTERNWTWKIVGSGSGGAGSPPDTAPCTLILSAESKP